MESDEKTYFLGDTIFVHFGVRNNGAQSFKIEEGGDYRGGTRQARFHLKAYDSSGNEVQDPDAAQTNMGGLSGAVEVKPGETKYFSLNLNRYCLFETSGTYQITARHDFGWPSEVQSQIPEAKLTLILLSPTPKQAEEVLTRLRKKTGERMFSGVGTKLSPYADFGAIRYPSYLPALRTWAMQGSTDAVEGISSVHTPKATEILLDLALSKTTSPQVSFMSAKMLPERLPSDWEKQKESSKKWPSLLAATLFKERQQRASWQPELMPRVCDLGRKFMDRGWPDSAEGARLLVPCVDRQDLSRVLKGLDDSLKDSHPASYVELLGGAVSVWIPYDELAKEYVKKELPLPDQLNTPPERTLALLGMGQHPSYRPTGWLPILSNSLRDSYPQIRWLALSVLPQELPKELQAPIIERLSDPVIDVQIKACEIARQHPDPVFRKPLLSILRKTESEYALEYLAAAAEANGLKREVLGILVDRITDPHVGRPAVVQLIERTVENPQWSSQGSSAGDPETQAIQGRWRKFINRYGDAFLKGERFKVGDARLTPDLIPQEITLHIDSNPWPKR